MCFCIVLTYFLFIVIHKLLVKNDQHLRIHYYTLQKIDGKSINVFIKLEVKEDIYFLFHKYKSNSKEINLP